MAEHPGAQPAHRPAFYSAGPGGWRDWWTVLHPPYTAWHLAYVVIGACLAPRVDAGRLAATLVAFFAAVGVAAHTLDEWHGRPLRTRIPSAALLGAAVAGLGTATGLGIVGVARVGWVLVPFVVMGPLLVLAYNLELLGGLVHTDVGFAVAWGAFPVLGAYAAQAGDVGLPAALAAAGAVGWSYAQRSLSTPARTLRRRVLRVEGALRLRTGETRALDVPALLAPLERALRAMSWAVVALAAAMAVARLS